MKRFHHLILSALFFLSVPLVVGAAESEDEDSGLAYRLLGPAAGGRTTRVVGVPGDPLSYYLATAAGGVWKSSNGGTEWESVFDDQPVSSIGSVAVANTNPGVV